MSNFRGVQFSRLTIPFPYVIYGVEDFAISIFAVRDDRELFLHSENFRIYGSYIGYVYIGCDRYIVQVKEVIPFSYFLQ